MNKMNEMNEGRREGRKEWSQERTKDWMNQSINHAIFRNHPRFLPPKNPPTEMLNFPLASKAMWRRIRPPGNGPKSSCKWSAPSGLEFEKAPCIFSAKNKNSDQENPPNEFFVGWRLKNPGWFLKKKDCKVSMSYTYIDTYMYIL